jgi:hypothetical protein
VLARARRLDGRVEREEVRLLGDGADGLDDGADLLRALAELVDDLADCCTVVSTLLMRATEPATASLPLSARS